MVCAGVLFSAHYVLLMFCYMQLIAHYLCILHVCSSVFSVAHCSLGVALVYFMLLTAHYLSLMFAMWRSLLITYGFLVFAVCCSLLMGYSYPLCGLQLNMCYSYSVYQSQTQNIYWFSCYYCTKMYIKLNKNF